MRQIRNLLASLGDSGASALSSFLVGIVALRAFTVHELALYALLFSAGTAAAIIPQQMAYLPRRILLNKSRDVVRPRYSRDLVSAGPPSSAAVILVGVSGAPLYAAVTLKAGILMACGAMAWVACSAFQEHVRAALHITGNHGYAALVSLVKLVIGGCALAIVVVWNYALPQIVLWGLPFGSLAIAALASSLIGVAAHRHTAPVKDTPTVSFSTSVRTATGGFILQGAGYTRNLIVALALGSPALAQLESARVAAQPIFVAANALSSYYLPSVVRLQQSGHRRAGSRRVGVMMAIQTAIGGVYAALLPVLVGPLEIVAGRAIDTALAATRSVAFALHSMVAPLNYLNIAEGRYTLANVSTVLSVVASLATLAALIHVTGVYAEPISVAVGALVRGSALLVAHHRNDEP